MKILIVDSNIVFAKKVGRFLKENLREVVVRYATNVPILRRRLSMEIYDYIIADVVSAFDSEGMTEALKSTETPTIVWAVLDASKDIYQTFCHRSLKQVIAKPNTERSIAETVSSISSFMLPAVGSR